MTSFGYIMVTYFSVLVIGGLSLLPIAPKLIWNASASVPIGLYTVDTDHPLEITDLVAVRAPEPLAGFMEERGYLPRGVPLLKRVAALPRQEVCRDGSSISVDGIPMAEALDNDRARRPLPAWQGCRRVADGEIFLLNWDVRDSFDSRYFGPVRKSSVIGRAVPLLTDESGDGRFEWRAPTR